MNFFSLSTASYWHVALVAIYATEFTSVYFFEINPLQDPPSQKIGKHSNWNSSSSIRLGSKIRAKKVHSHQHVKRIYRVKILRSRLLDCKTVPRRIPYSCLLWRWNFNILKLYARKHVVVQLSSFFFIVVELSTRWRMRNQFHQRMLATFSPPRPSPPSVYSNKRY